MTTSNEDKVLIDKHDVKALVGNPSDRTLHRYLNDPRYAYLRFPKPIMAGKRRLWLKNEIVAVQARLIAGDPQAQRA